MKSYMVRVACYVLRVLRFGWTGDIDSLGL